MKKVEARFLEIVKNYASTMVFIAFGYFYYWNAEYHRGFLAATYKLNFAPGISFTSQDVFLNGVLLYAALLIPFYWLPRHRGVRSKARIVLSFLHRRFVLGYNIGPAERASAANAGRALIIKFFYAPLMVKWLFDHIFGMVNTGHALPDIGTIFSSFSAFLNAYNSNGFWFLFDLILFSDVVFFTLGYLVETPYLGNEIVSAEPSLFGWVVCLACYPPFNKATNAFLGWHSTDFPHFDNPYVHVALSGLLLALMGFYAFASVALNFKGSNLTNRGIVGWGPYAVVRHPAYAAKNLAWWIGGIPAIYAAIESGSAAQVFLVFLALGGTSTIYCLRALTEETHLLKGKNGYAEYCQKVKYRFIPGLI